MVHLTVSDECAQLIAKSSTPVIVVDRTGRRLGQIGPVDSCNATQPTISAERLVELERRAKEPGEYSTLEEIKQRLGWIKE